jgi:hypothetical protein
MMAGFENSIRLYFRLQPCILPEPCTANGLVDMMATMNDYMIGERHMEIKLYHIDSLDYSGSIDVMEGSWNYRGVTNDHLISVTTGMPLKAVLSCLVAFDLVYDVIE